MNQFDIQMAILGPRVAAQIREFNDKNVKTIDFGELTDNIPEAQLMDIYQRIQKAIEKVGYSFSERSREEDFYFRTRSGMNGYTANLCAGPQTVPDAVKTALGSNIDLACQNYIPPS